MPSPSLDIEAVAHLARLQLTPDEVETFSSQLDKVLDHIRQLEQVDISNVEPTAHASPVYNVVREDCPTPGSDPEEMLANAPRSANSLVIVPKVLE